MEAWRNNLHNTLNQNKFYPYQEWNNSLLDWCKEYAIEIIRYDGLDAFPCQLSKPDKGKVQLVIAYKNVQPFIIYLHYVSNADTKTPVLQISFTEKIDYSKRFAKKFMNNFTDENDDEEEYYNWIEDSIDFNYEPYALDKGFVLEYITIQFNKYLTFIYK
jgi:hypothetical protein